jgi:hypothetical protein
MLPTISAEDVLGLTAEHLRSLCRLLLLWEGQHKRVATVLRAIKALTASKEARRALVTEHDVVCIICSAASQAMDSAAVQVRVCATLSARHGPSTTHPHPRGVRGAAQHVEAELQLQTPTARGAGGPAWAVGGGADHHGSA